MQVEAFEELGAESLYSIGFRVRPAPHPAAAYTIIDSISLESTISFTTTFTAATSTEAYFKLTRPAFFT